MTRISGIAVAIFAFVAWSCGGGTSPSGPSAPAKSISPAASGYLSSAIDVMATYSLRRKSIDWNALRESVLKKAGAAQTIPETYEAIVFALGLLGDSRSYFKKPDGSIIPNPNAPSCSEGAPATPHLTAFPSLSRLVVSSCSVEDCDPTGYAQGLQNAIAVGEAEGVTGWIIDLRQNSRGSVFAMVAGVGPVLGEGDVAAFVDADGHREAIAYAGGAVTLDGSIVAQLPAAYALRGGSVPRVAVLTGRATAGAGEMVAIAFKGRANARSFGVPTCGIPTAVQYYALSDNAQLVLAVSATADRNGVNYESAVVPDEVISDPTDAVLRAAQWLISK